MAPARIALAKLEAQLVGEMDAPLPPEGPARRQWPSRYDFVVIDTPPALGLITVNALVAATHLLIPVQSSYFALEGTDDLLETVEKIRSRPNPNLKLLGAVITLHDKRTTLVARRAEGDRRRVRRPRLPDHDHARASASKRARPTRNRSSPSRRSRAARYEYYRLCEEVIERV